MAGSIAVTTREVTNNVLQYSVAWTSDAAGAVNGTSFDIIVGTIVAVEFVPGAGGSAPTALHDIDLLDEEGVTMFDDGSGTSIGSNLSDTVASHKVPLVGLVGVTIYRRWHHGGSAELRVSGAGDTKSGTVNIFVSAGVL